MKLSKLALASIFALSSTLSAKALACHSNGIEDAKEDMAAVLDAAYDIEGFDVQGFRSVTLVGRSGSTSTYELEVEGAQPTERGEQQLCLKVSFEVTGERTEEANSCGERTVRVKRLSGRDSHRCAKLQN